MSLDIKFTSVADIDATTAKLVAFRTATPPHPMWAVAVDNGEQLPAKTDGGLYIVARDGEYLADFWLSNSLVNALYTPLSGHDDVAAVGDAKSSVLARAKYTVAKLYNTHCVVETLTSGKTRIVAAFESAERSRHWMRCLYQQHGLPREVATRGLVELFYAPHKFYTGGMT